MSELTAALGVGAAVILVAALAVRVSVRLGLPSLVLYLGIGVLLGESGLGIQFSDAELTQSLGLAALVLILVEGGLTTRWSDIRPAVGAGLALSTVGVLISIGVAGLVLHHVLGLDWRTALLWGAVLASTDAAAVFSVLRRLPITRRLAGSLELESGINDAPCYIAVVLLVGTEPIGWDAALLMAYELAVGALIGGALGWLGAQALRRAALPATGLYPLAAVSVCVLAFAGGQAVHASGLLAAYLSGLVLGNAKLPHRSDTLSFAEGLGWLAQIGLFVLLGLFASPGRLLDAIVPGLVAGAVVTFIARPLSVALSATWFGMPWREQVFLSWAGLRGAVPVVLAMIPLSQGRPGSELLVDAVFVLVVVLTLVQGTTLKPLARALGLDSAAQAHEVQVDVASLDELDAHLLQLTIPKGSKLHGVYISELRLPPGATVSLVARAGGAFTPGPTTRLQEDDHVLIVTTEAVRDAAEARLRAVDRAGRYARWRGETGTA
ncbi:potassium/proton antiporter [Actinokineospora sp. UTMC 2448]|uniref:potassium/proton antiporter n=1 Tax=Actinokineospora sp. UTMC 2448 TaxID=2268449 RepID=UPI00216414CC|nr:potassium/proton antiporter [Actinokineospora sp. UTMC 2448]UVS80921.1 potassium/proton antiporter [Actinokineospora sp. UTMC 2448]